MNSNFLLRLATGLCVAVSSVASSCQLFIARMSSVRPGASPAHARRGSRRAPAEQKMNSWWLKSLSALLVYE